MENNLWVIDFTIDGPILLKLGCWFRGWILHHIDFKIQGYGSECIFGCSDTANKCVFRLIKVNKLKFFINTQYFVLKISHVIAKHHNLYKYIYVYDINPKIKLPNQCIFLGHRCSQGTQSKLIKFGVDPPQTPNCVNPTPGCRGFWRVRGKKKRK